MAFTICFFVLNNYYVILNDVGDDAHIVPQESLCFPQDSGYQLFRATTETLRYAQSDKYISPNKKGDAMHLL